MTREGRGRLGRTAIVLAAAAVLVGAGRLPRLPADIDLPRSGDSPGPVTFSHEMHVDASRPDCTGCHPRLFPMGVARENKAVRITHAAMEKKQLCGACHDGTRAVGFDDCTTCHRSE
jgi:c(7)-type cytochrome triheme protein